jgi:hypothetical protein
MRVWRTLFKQVVFLSAVSLFNALDTRMHFLSRTEICPKPPLLGSGVFAPFGQLVPGTDRWNVKLTLSCFKGKGFRNMV